MSWKPKKLHIFMNFKFDKLGHVGANWGKLGKLGQVGTSWEPKKLQNFDIKKNVSRRKKKERRRI